MIVKIERCSVDEAQEKANEMSLAIEANGRKVVGVDIFTTRTTGNHSDPQVEVAVVVKYIDQYS